MHSSSNYSSRSTISSDEASQGHVQFCDFWSSSDPDETIYPDDLDLLDTDGSGHLAQLNHKLGKISSRLSLVSKKNKVNAVQLLYHEYVAKGHPSLTTSKTEEHQLDHRILGELAFQLERRIISTLFPGQTRFYGFCLKHIEMTVSEEADPLRRVELKYKLDKLTKRLGEVNFDMKRHSRFTCFLINTYGVAEHSLRNVTASAVENYLNTRLSGPEKAMKGDLLVIFESLRLLAQEDGVFMFW